LNLPEIAIGLGKLFLLVGAFKPYTGRNYPKENQRGEQIRVRKRGERVERKQRLVGEFSVSALDQLADRYQ
jgi:hypothetical protein